MTGLAVDSLPQATGEVTGEIATEEDIPSRHFDKEVLFQLLVAEMSGYRGQHLSALDRYVRMAEETRDPGVAARATRLGAYLKYHDLAIRAATIWTAEDPDNEEAHRFAAELMLKTGDLEGAVREMEAIRRLGGAVNFESFAYMANDLSESERQSLLGAVEALREKLPEDPQLKFSHAVLLEEDGQLQEALVLAEALLEEASLENNQNIIVLKVNLLKQLQRNKEALAFIRRQVKRLPEYGRLRLIYARFLFEADELDKAREQYEIELARQTDRAQQGDIVYALALIALEQKDDNVASERLRQMLDRDYREGEAHYYLGNIEERRGNPLAALSEYRQAGEGYEWMPAQSRIVWLLVDQGEGSAALKHLERIRISHPQHRDNLVLEEVRVLSYLKRHDELLVLLSDELTRNPDNIDFLYFRGLSWEAVGRLDLMEEDLRKVIQLRPDHADALNALGYTLADQTDRLQEAKALITRALTLRPEEPAIMDSMGWVEYRLKNFEVAIRYLKKALARFPNEEVAAHLGEVLWVAGNKREARSIWQQGLERDPESPVLKEVMERFLD